MNVGNGRQTTDRWGIIMSNNQFVGKFKSFYTNKTYKLVMNIKKDTLYFSLKDAKSEVFYSENLKFVRKVK